MKELDNDMDDLFREAAANYPLRVSGADWSKVQAALSYQAVEQASAGKRKWWWVLLLLLVPFVCVQLRGSRFATAGQLQPVAANATRPAETMVTISSFSNTTILPFTYPFSHTGAYGQSSDSIVAAFNRSMSELYELTAGAAITVSMPVPEMEESQNIIAEAPVDQPGDPAIEQEKGRIADSLSTVMTEQPKAVAAKKTKQPEEKGPKAVKFYINALAGIGADKVKDSRFSPLSKSAGISAGYNISKRFAVEAGAFWSEKNYRTAYKYFNNSKTQWPSVRRIETVEGSCQMIELPVTLRYNFKPGAKHSFFAAAGLSSWIMKKEDYEYDYTTAANPTQQNSVYKTYKNSGRSWLSILQLSAGWQYNAGKLGAVRVQPYYNMPLSGAGIGKLPISGVGVLAGFSFMLH